MRNLISKRPSWARPSLLVALMLISTVSAAQLHGALEASETRLIFQTEQLRQIGAELNGGQSDSELTSLKFAGKPLGNLSVKANAEGVPHNYLDGALTHEGGFSLSRLGFTATVDRFLIRGASDDSTAIIISDPQGNALFRGDFIHYHGQPDKRAATLREMDMALSHWLAEKLGEPRLAGFVIGTMEIDVEFAALPATAVAKGATCGEPIWIDESKGLVPDIRLVKLGKGNNNSINPLQQRARDDGFVAVTVNAQLDNAGTADAPWYEKFRLYQGGSEPVNPPYDNDQHPYLVWAMYRQVGVRLESLGFSPVKHAFYAVNNPCTAERDECAMSPSDGRLLRYGCEDFYGIASNDNPRHLGPRSEIAAATNVWVSTGSFFDKNSDGVQDSDTTSRPGNMPLERRMKVLESDLDSPGAQYFAEAWYLNRDDADIYNSMGTIEVDPDFVDASSTWVFPAASGAAYSFGPTLNQWVDPDAIGANEANEEFTTPNGTFRVAAKVEDLGDGRYRYVYVLMNLDFDPQIQTMELPISTGTTLSDYYFANGDHDAASDWVPAQDITSMNWQAPTGLGLDWGLMATFEFISTAAPETGTLTMNALEDGTEYNATVPVPTGFDSNDLIFDDGFE